jgi:hypothetical protein
MSLDRELAAIRKAVDAGYTGHLDVDNGALRTFSTGATRDTGEDKHEPWGFTSALVEQRYSEYMHGHRVQSDGNLRPSDNWKKGIPTDVYYHSLSRHIQDLRLIWEGNEEFSRTPSLIEALCAIKFNVDGLLHELVKEQGSSEEARD